MERTKEVFPERLKMIRREKGLTQAEFADATGVSRQSVYLYEKGLRKPAISVLGKIYENTGVSIEWLIGINEGKYVPSQPKSAEELINIVQENLELLCDSDRMHLIWILSGPRTRTNRTNKE